MPARPPAAPAGRSSGNSAAASRSCSPACRERPRACGSVLCFQERSMLRSFNLSLLLAAALAAAPCDLIVSARYVVTMSAQRRVIEDGAVAIRGERIAAVGPRAEIDRDWQPKRRIDRPS